MEQKKFEPMKDGSLKVTTIAEQEVFIPHGQDKISLGNMKINNEHVIEKEKVKSLLLFLKSNIDNGKRQIENFNKQLEQYADVDDEAMPSKDIEDIHFMLFDWKEGKDKIVEDLNGLRSGIQGKNTGEIINLLKTLIKDIRKMNKLEKDAIKDLNNLDRWITQVKQKKAIKSNIPYIQQQIDGAKKEFEEISKISGVKV